MCHANRIVSDEIGERYPLICREGVLALGGILSQVRQSHRTGSRALGSAHRRAVARLIG